MHNSVVRSVRCGATAHRSGERCKLLAIRGGRVCQVHGGSAPQVRAAAAQRVVLAEAAAKGDRRPPGVILLDTLHLLDTRMRQLLDDSDTGAAAMLEAIDQASALARDVVRLRVDEQAVDLQRRQVEDDQAKLVHAALRVALDHAGFSPEQQDRAAAELAAVLSRVEAEGERAVLVEARKLRPVQPALMSGVPS